MAGEPSGQADDHITDAHREAAIEALREAAGDGVIDLEEFGDRAGVVFAAERVDEIRSVLTDLGGADLPVHPPTETEARPPAPPPPSADAQYVVAVMSGADRRGAWRAKSQINAVAIMGGCTLDFRHAELSAPVTQVNAVTVMGGVDVVVPEGVPVEVDGFVLMGGVDNKTRAATTPGAPMIRVTAAGMMGGVTVRHPRRKKTGADRGAVPTPVMPLPPPPLPTPPTSAGPMPTSRGSGAEGSTVTLLCSQLDDSAALAETLGDRGWFDVLQVHNRLLQGHFDTHGGRVVKTHGDGFLVSFQSARHAVRCAIAIQRAFLAHRTQDPATDLHLRIGLHSGEVITAGADLFGRNVDLVGRIASEASADEIHVSAVTKMLTEAGGDVDFGVGRTATMPDVPGEWTVYPVRWT